MFLSNLHSLVLNLAEYVQNLNDIFSNIFRLPKLKYGKITYRIRIDQDLSSGYFSRFHCIPIETLIFNGPFSNDSLNNLLYHFPKLHHLSINYLAASRDENSETHATSLLKHLKYVSLKLHLIAFNKFEQIVQTFFGDIEVLRISTQYDTAYLDAKRWEHLITSYMPNLRIFDIHHDGGVQRNQLTYHDLINQFRSSFWIERDWFFAHQHDWLERLHSGVFDSTEPYRRKDFTFYWQLDKQICQSAQETNLNSVKHVYICSTKTNKNPANYFPNATELTIKHCLEKLDDLLVQTLNRIVPLRQLTKLIIKDFHINFDKFIDVLYLRPHLHTFKSDFLSLNSIYPSAIRKTGTFRHVLHTNRIKTLELRHECTLEEIQLIVDLFRQLNYLNIGMKSKEIEPIVQYQLTVMIEKENVLDDYLIKFVNRDMYLWC
ncbi:unnamed protein product [Rotaria sp. Silwood2]|nr:unnamed protein product [Rotaria sp. Silwood2]